ncbi:glycosyltransferase family 90 protein [Apiospora hydei]|uniref:Glycosyltransferase family 90 protein n=1 Tax=Apiospora hydei TaxID=1337664 RepID=A0ABR1WPL9_9PEZI
MLGPPTKGPTQVLRAAAAAVLGSLISHHVATKETEVHSELLCWILLPLLSRVPWPQSGTGRLSKPVLDGRPSAARPSSGLLWVLAFCISLAAVCKSENGEGELQPLLTPLLLTLQGHYAVAAHSPTLGSTKGHGHDTGTLQSRVYGAVAVSAIAILSLLRWDLKRIALHAIPLAALYFAYTILLRRANGSSLRNGNLAKFTTSLSLRTAFILKALISLEVLLLGFPTVALRSVVLGGLAKAVFWYFVAQAAQSTTWCIAPAIETFGILASRTAWAQSSELQALVQIVASVLALGQVLYMLPRHVKAKSFLWLLMLFPIIQLIVDAYTARTTRLLAQQSFDYYHEHPVEALMANGNEAFRGLLQRQSQNYTAACDEYRRRYKMEPPPGFQSWYEFAASNNSPIIDDFDNIYDSIAPFWGTDGAEVSEKMTGAFDMANSELWLCSVSGASAEFGCSHPFRTHDRHMVATFNKLLGGLSGKLPDVRFLVNHFDEPAVLVPSTSGQSPDRIDLTYLSQSSTWDALTKHCKHDRDYGKHPVSRGVRTYGLPFVHDIDAAKDICKHPEYSSMHGLLMSPTSFRLIEGLVPVMSTGSLSTMGDILFPSPAYTDDEFRYDSAGDIDWEDKQNNLYWAGSTTGGYVREDDTWSQFHRQRFVMVAQNLRDRENIYLRASETGVVRPVASDFLDRRLFDVAFTQIFSCTWRQCRDQRRRFDVRPWADRDAPLRSRLAFDLDGNGISGRFYRLLASQSAPLKQTLLREWHDERLVPWVHYIPVSQGLGELPELVLYLTSTETGQQRAREIADNGREWFQKAFREVDFTIYMYRLLLELARLQDPERKATVKDMP